MAKRKKVSPLKGRKHKKYGTVKKHVRRVKGIGATTKTVPQLKKQLKLKLEGQLGDLAIRKFKARTKRDKKKIQKKISAKQSEIRKIS